MARINPPFADSLNLVKISDDSVNAIAEYVRAGDYVILPEGVYCVSFIARVDNRLIITMRHMATFEIRQIQPFYYETLWFNPQSR